MAGARRGHKRSPLVAVLIVLLGVALLLYPLIASVYNNMRQRQFAEEYNTSVEQVGEDARRTALEDARDYNSTLAGIPILDPYRDYVAADPQSRDYQEYQAQLDDTSAMARVRVPSAEIDLPVYHDTTDDVLVRGVGHLYGTSMPVGGERTHAVLTSHTGMPNATLFDNLDDVAEGDLIFIDVMGETLAYKVNQIKIVEPTEFSDLVAEPGHDYVTLFTCTPYAVNSHRLLVRGERVPYEQAADQDSVGGSSLQPWMWWVLAGAAVGGIAVVGILVRERRRNTSARRSDEPVSQPS